MKKIISLALSFLFMTSLGTISAFASNIPALEEPGAVTIEPAAYGIPQEVVDDILADNPGEHITIHNWTVAEPSPSPRIAWVKITEKTTLKAKTEVKDVFVISVAKGGSKKLTSTWKTSVSASVTANGVTASIAKAALGLTAKIEKTYSKSESFSGPPESSKYNSREYRVKFYESSGTWKGTSHSEGFNSVSVSGTWKEPHSYAEYSKDKNI